MLNNLPQMHLELVQEKETPKAAEATGDLIDNKTADKKTNISRTSTQKTSEKVPSETEVTGTKERYHPQKQDANY